MARSDAAARTTRRRSRRQSIAGWQRHPPDTAEKEKFLREHFPNVAWTAKRLDFECHFLSADWLTAGSLQAAYHRDRELARLDRVEELLQELWYEVLRLAPSDTRAKDNVQMRLGVLIYDLVGTAPFATAGGKDSTVLPPKQGSLDLRRQDLGLTYPLHPTQAGLRAKAQLVDHARDLWRRFKRRTPPRSPSPRAPFFELVGDLIWLARCDWGVENTLRAWRTLNPD